jgi:hypothetical protein
VGPGVALVAMSNRWAGNVVLFAVSLSLAQEPSGSLTPEEAWQHIGEEEVVCGQIVDTSYVKSVRDSPTYLFLERPPPEQVFTVVLPAAKRDVFGESPEKSLKGKNICVRGKVEGDRLNGTVDRKHRATVLIEDEEQITLL